MGAHGGQVAALVDLVGRRKFVTVFAVLRYGEVGEEKQAGS